MRNVSIDTNVYAAFKRNDNRIVKSFQHLDIIALDIVVLAELYTGFKSGSREKNNRQELELFLNNKRISILLHDANTAEFYSDIFIKLKNKGKPIPTNDIWIAATAMQNGLSFFTLDSHFDEIDGLLLKTDF